MSFPEEPIQRLRMIASVIHGKPAAKAQLVATYLDGYIGQRKEGEGVSRQHP